MACGHCSLNRSCGVPLVIVICAITAGLRFKIKINFIIVLGKFKEGVALCVCCNVPMIE